MLVPSSTKWKIGNSFKRVYNCYNLKQSHFSWVTCKGEPSVAAEEEQRRKTEGVAPSVEKWLRGHLRKLDGWGVSDLMRTEQSIDHEQKRRANTSTNPRELALLADDEDLGVRFFVAANPAHTARFPYLPCRGSRRNGSNRYRYGPGVGSTHVEFEAADHNGSGHET